MPRTSPRWTQTSLQALASGVRFFAWSFALLSLERLFAFLSYGSELAFFGLIGAVLGWIGALKIGSALRVVQGVGGEEPAQTQALETTKSPTTTVTMPAMEVAPESVAAPTPASAPEPTPAVVEPPSEPIDWELWIGRRLLPALGIGIVLIGMLVFLKYSFDNRWIDELGRIVLSVLAATGFLVFGEWHHRKYHQWSGWFTGAGLVLLYFTVWVAHVFYAEALLQYHQLVLPPALAGFAYMAITSVGALAASRYRNQAIAWCTFIGGYLTPFLVETPTQDVATLVVYLFILTVGLLGLAWHNRWRYLNLASFTVVQLYLFSLVYPVTTWSDPAQAGTAVLFFVLFGMLPLLYQFRLKLAAEADDVLVILGSTVAVAIPVIDAIGGLKSDAVGFMCLALAAVHLAFAAGALQYRKQDSTFIDTYVIGSAILIALGILAQLKIGWVSVGWAVFSVALLEAACRVQRGSLWAMSRALLVLSLLSLMYHLPLRASSEALWHPLTSMWSLQSYVIFACVSYWIYRLRTVPQQLLTLSRADTQGALHGVLCLLTFAFFTFEATQLHWHISVPWSMAYVFLGALAVVAYMYTGATAWLLLTIAAQSLAFLFLFFWGKDSSLLLFGRHGVSVITLWSLPALLLLVLAVATPFMLEQSRNRAQVAALRLPFIVAALAQVWIHGTVELRNLAWVLNFTEVATFRVVSGWWMLFALAVGFYGLWFQKPKWRTAGSWLLGLPFCYFLATKLDHTSLTQIDTFIWTVLPVVLLWIGGTLRHRDIEMTGILYLCATAAIDMLVHMGDRASGTIITVWWAVAAAVVMGIGFSTNHSSIRRVSIALFAATAFKLLFIDFSVLTVPVRIAASIATGLLMIGASYLYQRFGATNSK
jgi:Predicted membrane protein (DUF2339)